MWDGKRRERELRQIAIDYLGGKCVQCGSEDTRVFEFHHREGRKGGLTMAQLHYSLEEADRCDLLCANCHRIVTFRD